MLVTTFCEWPIPRGKDAYEYRGKGRIGEMVFATMHLGSASSCCSKRQPWINEERNLLEMDGYFLIWSRVVIPDGHGLKYTEHILHTCAYITYNT